VANGDFNVQLPILNNDELGLATRVFNEMVVEMQQSHTKLKQLATTDNLTQLANRKLILENLLQQFECFHRYKKVFSILMVDLDLFKNINDTYGHQAGDTVLRQVGEIFIDALRNVDIAGRYGGEEFLIILTETDGDNAVHTAERIRQMVRSYPFSIANQPQITASIGVATVLKEDENEGSLIDRADRALYQAKDNGRDQVVYLPRNSSTPSGKEKLISLQSAA
jgi:diguanylate cyclase (GGDEF)-like protein